MGGPNQVEMHSVGNAHPAVWPNALTTCHEGDVRQGIFSGSIRNLEVSAEMQTCLEEGLHYEPPAALAAPGAVPHRFLP